MQPELKGCPARPVPLRHCLAQSLTEPYASFRIRRDILSVFKEFGRVSFVDALHLSIALGPLAVYLMVLGLVNLATRPFVTTGTRDTAALGLAISGLVVAGPMELFLPEAAAQIFGPWIWLLLLGAYALALTLLILLLRPRLVIYNIAIDQLRAVLSEVVTDLDREARWVGDSLVLPRLHVQLHVEPFAALKNIQLVSSGPRQSDAGWRRLENALVPALRKSAGTPNPYAVSFLMFGLLMVGIITLNLVGNSHEVVVQWNEMLRR